jgi:hypothetical protein
MTRFGTEFVKTIKQFYNSRAYLPFLAVLTIANEVWKKLAIDEISATSPTGQIILDARVPLIITAKIPP